MNPLTTSTSSSNNHEALNTLKKSFETEKGILTERIDSLKKCIRINDSLHRVDNDVTNMIVHSDIAKCLGVNTINAVDFDYSTIKILGLDGKLLLQVDYKVLYNKNSGKTAEYELMMNELEDLEKQARNLDKSIRKVQLKILTS